MPSAPVIPPTISTSPCASGFPKYGNGIHPAALTARAAFPPGGVSRQRLMTAFNGSVGAGAAGTAAPALFQELNGWSSQLAGTWTLALPTTATSRTTAAYLMALIQPTTTVAKYAGSRMSITSTV